MTPVDTSPMAKLTTVTAISIRFIGSRSCCNATRSTDGGCSAAISLGPNVTSRVAASAAVSPFEGSDPRWVTTSVAAADQGTKPSLIAPAADVVSRWVVLTVGLLRSPLSSLSLPRTPGRRDRVDG